MKAMLFIREIGQTTFVKENGLFEDREISATEELSTSIETGDAQAYDKGQDMCINGSVEAFQVWGLEGEYSRVTKIEVQSA